MSKVLHEMNVLKRLASIEKRLDILEKDVQELLHNKYERESYELEQNERGE